MNLYQLTCPGCRAILDVDDNMIDIMYCKYCGSKIILDGQSDATVNAKANVIMHKEKMQYKKQKVEAEETTKRHIADVEGHTKRHIVDAEEQTKQTEIKSRNSTNLWVLIIMAIGMLLVLYGDKIF